MLSCFTSVITQLNAAPLNQREYVMNKFFEKWIAIFKKVKIDEN